MLTRHERRRAVPELLRFYLEYVAADGNGDAGATVGDAVALNPFEEHVLTAMRDLGRRVAPHDEDRDRSLAAAVD